MVANGIGQHGSPAQENAGLEMGRLEMQYSTKPAGQVIEVRPGPGEKLTLPARVDLVVSRGPATAELPK